MTKMDHLAMAKEALAIADAENAKREAYKRAAEHVAAHIKETGDTLKDVATFLGRKYDAIQKLDQWRRTGYEAETPWLMDPNATRRAARSHAKKLAREEPESIADAIKAAPPEARQQAIKALAEDKATADEVTTANIAAISKRESAERERAHKAQPRDPRKGALDAWGEVTSRSAEAEYRAKLALDAIKSVDVTVSDALKQDALNSVNVTIAAWELVAATLRGESIGDQVEAFLASHE